MEEQENDQSVSIIEEETETTETMNEQENDQRAHILGVIITQGYPLLLFLMFTGVVCAFDYHAFNDWPTIILFGLIGRGVIFVAHMATRTKFDFAEVTGGALGAAIIGSGVGSLCLFGRWIFGDLPYSFSWSKYFSMLFHNIVLGLII